MGLFDGVEMDEDSKDHFNEMPDELRSKLAKLDLKNIKSKKDMIKHLENIFGEDNLDVSGDTIVVKTKVPRKDEDIADAVYNAIAINDTKWEKVIKYMADFIELKPSCVDANGTEMKRNDFLTAEGKRKRVLRVGYKYAILSQFNDMNTEDGVWFEERIKKARAVIEKENE